NMASDLRTLGLPILVVGFLLNAVPSTSLAQKQKRPSVQPRPPANEAASFPTKSKLTGENLTLSWDHFKHLASPPIGKAIASGVHSLAYTMASFNISTSYEWTQESPFAPRIWRIGAVVVEIKMRDDLSWVRESLFVTDQDSSKEKARKEDVLSRLLEHEQGHYDIVALVARDLYHDLLGLKNLKSEQELTRQVEQLRDGAETHLQALNGRYDEQCGMVDRDRENQQRWTKLLAQSKAGKRLDALFASPADAPKQSK